MTRADLVAVLAVGVILRMIGSAWGLRFDFAPAHWYWQFLDLGALRVAPWESLWHLHAQPPLLNAITALALQLFGEAAPRALGLLFAALGVAMNLAVFGLVLAGTGRRGVAWAVTGLVACAPAFVVFERHLFTAHLVACFLVGSVYALDRWARTRHLAWLAAYAAGLLLVTLTRSMYAPVWLALLLAVALVGSKPTRREWAVVVAMTLLALAVPAKNALLFETFSSSSWSGMNLYNAVYNQSYTEEELSRFYAGEPIPRRRPPGSTAPVGDRRPFGPPERYPESSRPEPAGVAVLDRDTRQSGATNYNASFYLELSRQYAEDWARVVRRDPTVLARVFASSLGYYFRPATDDSVLPLSPVTGSNLERLAPLVAVYRSAVYARLPGSEAGVSPVLVLGTVLLFGGGAYRAWRSRGEPEARVLFAIVAIVGYAFTVGNLFENYENMRFRFEGEALFWVGIALILFPMRAGENEAPE